MDWELVRTSLWPIVKWALIGTIPVTLVSFAIGLVLAFVVALMRLGKVRVLSLLARSESQAVQYAMLALLAGLFFGGFFLDLDAFRYPVKLFSWVLPVTYGVRLLRDVMLRGVDPAMTDLVGLAATAVVFGPLDASVDTLGQVGLPVAVALGKIGLAVAIVGFVAATLGAACETGLSVGYSISQYYGWQWGKYVRPREAARFHVLVLATLIVSVLIGISGVDPIKVTEYSIVLSAAALPLTYFPILIIANDPEYMGTRVNGRLANSLGLIYFVILSAVVLATIPLMIITKAGA